MFDASVASRASAPPQPAFTFPPAAKPQQSAKFGSAPPLTRISDPQGPYAGGSHNNHQNINTNNATATATSKAYNSNIPDNIATSAATPPSSTHIQRDHISSLSRPPLPEAVVDEQNSTSSRHYSDSITAASSSRAAALSSSSSSSSSSKRAHSSRTQSPLSPSLSATATALAAFAKGAAESAPAGMTSPQQQQQQQQEPREDPVLSSLLGSAVSYWNYSDESLSQALRLRAEQERTKQEFYRLELRKRSLDLLHEAMRYNIPPNSVPLLFSGSQLPADANALAALSVQIQQQQQQQQPPPPYVSSQSGPVPVFSSQSGLVPAPQGPPPPPPPPKRPSSHSRNLSLPPQPTIIPSEYQKQAAAAANPPPPQQQPPQLRSPPSFRPGHQHHSSTSAISFTSPVRGPPAFSTLSGPGPYPQMSTQQQPPPLARSGSWQINQPYFPPPQQPTISTSPSSPSSSLQHIIQFHHWQPSPSKASPSHSSPQTGDDSALKRRKSVSDRSTSPTPKSSSSTSGVQQSAATLGASAAAAHSQVRRRGLHSRHRSEASVLRGDSSGSSFRGWSGAPSAASLARQSSTQTNVHSTTPDPQSGVNVLATVASEQRERTPSPARLGSQPTQDEASFSGQQRREERAKKHEVDFMISDDPS